MRRPGRRSTPSAPGHGNESWAAVQAGIDPGTFTRARRRRAPGRRGCVRPARRSTPSGGGVTTRLRMA